MKSRPALFTIALVAGAASLGLAGQVLGQAAPAAAAATAPTPKLADGHPDLNGVWTGRGDPGVAAIGAGAKKDATGSVCLIGCANPGRPGGGAPGGAGGPPPGAFPQGGPPGGAGAGGPPPGAFPQGGPPGGPGAGGPPPGAGGGAPGGRTRDFPKYKPEFQAKVKDFSDRQVELDSALRCQLPGLPRIGPPSKIVQNAKEVVFLYDDLNGSFFRVIPTDGRGYRKGLPSSYFGDAVGHWEGDTLVVETVNFNDETWLIDNGAFHTKNLKVVERLRRVGDAIEYRSTAIDPAVLVEPWELRPRMLKLSNEELEETARCEDRTIEHVVDASHHDNTR